MNIEGVDYGSTPMSGVGIAPGEYEVTFERSEEKLDEYFPENITQNITVISGQTTAIRYDEGGEIAPVME